MRVCVGRTHVSCRYAPSYIAKAVGNHQDTCFFSSGDGRGGSGTMNSLTWCRPDSDCQQEKVDVVGVVTQRLRYVFGCQFTNGS